VGAAPGNAMLGRYETLTTFVMKSETSAIVASGKDRRTPTPEERRQMVEELRRKYSAQLARAPRWKAVLIEIRIALDAWCLELHRLHRSENRTTPSSTNERTR